MSDFKEKLDSAYAAKALHSTKREESVTQALARVDSLLHFAGIIAARAAEGGIPQAQFSIKEMTHNSLNGRQGRRRGSHKSAGLPSYTVVSSEQFSGWLLSATDDRSHVAGSDCDSVTSTTGNLLNSDGRLANYDFAPKVNRYATHFSGGKSSITWVDRTTVIDTSGDLPHVSFIIGHRLSELETDLATFAATHNIQIDDL